VGIIRDQIYSNEYELAHYHNKRLLYHPDMPTEFLNSNESSIFKQLTGGDPLWAEIKNSDERKVIEGNFPIVLACNGRPRIYLDEDLEAWERRLIVLNFKRPAHDKHFGKMGDLLFEKEGSGILNWLLEGRKKLVKDSLQLIQTKEQQARTSMLLLGSESPKAYVQNCLMKKQGANLGAVEMYENYQSWCRVHNLVPFASKQFHKIVKSEVEIRFGLRYRHDLVAENGKAMRGWKNLALVESGEIENAKNASVESREVAE